MKRFDIDSDTRLADVKAFIAGLSEAGGGDPAIAEKIEATRGIVEGVRARGDAALAEYTERFDRVALRPDQFEVSPEEIDAAVATVDPALIAILERAHENIRDFHRRGLRESWEETLPDGTVLGQRIGPVESAGVYVPGGQAFYPSSVLMNIVPARVAGVPEIVMVSPPSWNGGIHPAVLAAARIAGAARVFRVGGAQAIAALAYGTATIPAVTKITGPGNTFVTAAKALVRHVAEIDSEAGPSEVLVIADADANPAYVAAEMLAQAEHDEDAKSWLATPSPALADAVAAEVARKAAELPRRAIIEASIARHAAIFVTRDLDEAVDLANLIAAEHLSIQTADPRAVADRIRNAGAIMIGAHTPVAVGDYYAGPNHILPTGRQARFSSPLTAEAFRKVSSIIHYTPERLRASADDITRFAYTEELQAHAWSVEVRE